MTEPVAYYKDYNDGTTLYFRGSSLTETDKRDPLIKPLYTAEQLHPRVKMTQAEFDELEISLINAQFDYSELKKTIEIVPDMKFFVVRKLPNTGGNMLKCSKDGLLTYNVVKDAATQFDTKEEAEKWTNPLTEAVQLPVDGE